MSGRLLAVGDIHGCLKPLQVLVEDRMQLTKDDEVVFIGDYIDRGRNSKEVVDYILQLQKDGYQVITLKGNHEDMLLKSLSGDLNLIHWLYNGGRETLDSFGVRHPDDIDSLYLQFFENLQMFHCSGEYVFVHAGFNYKIEDPFQDEHMMLWTRKEAPVHPLFTDKTIIHGHTVTSLSSLKKRVLKRCSVLCIDTGCVYPSKTDRGYLSAVDLSNWELFVVKNTW